MTGNILFFFFNQFPFSPPPVNNADEIISVKCSLVQQPNGQGRKNTLVRLTTQAGMPGSAERVKRALSISILIYFAQIFIPIHLFSFILQ